MRITSLSSTTAEGVTLTSNTATGIAESVGDWQANPRWFWQQLADLRADFLGLLLRESIVPCEIRVLRPIPGQRFLLVNSPELAQQVLIGRASEFRKSHLTRKMIGKFLGNGLIVAEGEKHDRIRQAMTPLLNSRHLDCFTKAAQEEFQIRLRHWSNSESISLFTELQTTTFDIFLRCFTGSEPCAPLVAKKFAGALHQLGVAIGSRFTRIPWPDWLPTANNRADKQAIMQARDSARQLLASGPVTQTSATSLLGHLRQQIEVGNISESEAIDQTLTLLFAGHETMAVAFFWSLAYLASHPELQSQLRARLSGSRLTGDKPNDEPVIEPFVLELLRLYPPAWLFDRGVASSTQLGSGTVKPGDVLYVSPYTFHRNSIYFTEPNKFRLNRFTNYASALRGYGGSFMPFGLGARSCVGQRLALSQLIAVIAEVLRTSRLSSHEELPQPKPAATLQPMRDFRLTVEKI